MKVAQRLVLFITLFIVVFMVLYPPWVHVPKTAYKGHPEIYPDVSAGYHFITEQPIPRSWARLYNTHINHMRLQIQIILVSVFGIGVWMFLRKAAH